MPKRVVPSALAVRSASPTQKDRGKFATREPPVRKFNAYTTATAEKDPTRTAPTMRSRSGTLANRHPRLYRPNRRFDPIWATIRMARIGK